MHIFRKNPDFNHRNTRIYLETSALNYMYSLSPGVEGALATKAVHALKGNIFYASPVLLWELLLISDDKHRENLLDYCVNLCDTMLPKSPGELIIDNIIAKGEHVTYEDFSTKSSLADAWKNLHILPNQTIEFNKIDLANISNFVKGNSKHLSKVIDDFVFDGTFKGNSESLNVLMSIVYSKINYPNKNAPEWHVSARKIAILIMFLVMCSGMDVANEPMSQFWDKIDIEHPFDRLLHLAIRHPVSFYTGPVTFMAAVVAYQHSKGKTNRGAIHDGLHCGYLPYFDLFLTNDKLLTDIQLEAAPIYYDEYTKIRYISEMEYTLRPIQIDNQHPLL